MKQNEKVIETFFNVILNGTNDNDEDFILDESFTNIINDKSILNSINSFANVNNVSNNNNILVYIRIYTYIIKNKYVFI